MTRERAAVCREPGCNIETWADDRCCSRHPLVAGGAFPLPASGEGPDALTRRVSGPSSSDPTDAARRAHERICANTATPREIAELAEIIRQPAGDTHGIR